MAEESEHYEMKGPSIFRNKDETSLTQLQQNIMEQMERQKYENMTPQERLRSKLKAKLASRTNTTATQESKKPRKKKAIIPENIQLKD